MSWTARQDAVKSAEGKRSKSRSSSSSHHRGGPASANSSCLSSTAFTFDGIGSGDFQLDSLGADQTEINELLATLQNHDGAALMSDLTDASSLPFDALDSTFNFGFGGCSAGLGQRQPTNADAMLGSQNSTALSNSINIASSQAGGGFGGV